MCLATHTADTEIPQRGSGGERTDTPTDILPEGSASCVQSFDDSLDFAIRMTYRISLRSSSLWEPRHPLLKVV